MSYINADEAWHFFFGIASVGVFSYGLVSGENVDTGNQQCFAIMSPTLPLLRLQDISHIATSYQY